MRSKHNKKSAPVALVPFGTDDNSDQNRWIKTARGQAVSSRDPDIIVVLDRIDSVDDPTILDETLQVDSTFFTQPVELETIEDTEKYQRHRKYKTAGAWRRLLARSFDLTWQIMLIQFVMLKSLEAFQPDLAILVPVAGSAQLWLIPILLPAALILDAIFTAIVGNTPGKALLGLKVFCKSEDAVTPWHHLRRNILLWTSGFACGVPFLQLFTMGKQYSRVQRLKRATYDRRLDLWIGAKRLQLAQKFSFIALLFALMTAVVVDVKNVAVDQLIAERLPAFKQFVAKHADSDPIQSIKLLGSVTQTAIADVKPDSRPVFKEEIVDETIIPIKLTTETKPWTNPVTLLSTDINHNWSPATLAVYPPFYQFEWPAVSETTLRIELKADASGRSTLESVGNKYVNDRRHVFTFAEDPIQYQLEGRSYWEHKGRLASDGSIAVVVQIVWIENLFWIQEIVLPEAVKTLWPEADRLSASLWATWQKPES